ncbi:MAG: cupin domain-containing protein [Planctomycetota bacterium]
MAKITTFKGYEGDEPPKVPKPDEPVDPRIVTVQDGVPVVYPGCHGVGVRVVHPANPKAPAKNLGLVMFYVPPHVVLEPGSHETEETYVILEGHGLMTFANSRREVKKGDFVYLPPWCEHGIENTGTEPLVVLIATSPPNP